MSNQIRIQLDETRLNPGGTLTGKVGWEVEKLPRKAAVRLFWRTSGKGTEDLKVVDEIEVPQPARQQLFDFSFQLPLEPYSFQGRLLSITWGVEVVVDKQNELAELVIAPEGIARDLAAFASDDEEESFDEMND